MTNGVNKLTVLGSGTSTGVPLLGCSCSICTHLDKKNKRLRSSIFIETQQGQHILVDASPDLRAQLLREQITRVDTVFITHHHMDHCHGLDELRPLSSKQPIQLYSDPTTRQILTERFAYIFKRERNKKQYIAQLDFVHIPHLPTKSGVLGLPVNIKGESFEFFINPHGTIHTLAFVHHKMAYIIDCHEIHADVLRELRNKQLDLLIIDCASLSPHKTHLHLEKALSYMEAISPQLCGLIHLNHDFEHNNLGSQLRKRFFGQVIPLFDGQILNYGLVCHGENRHSQRNQK